MASAALHPSKNPSWNLLESSLENPLLRTLLLALFKSPSGGGGLTKMGCSNFSEVHWTLLFCSLKLLGPGDLRKQVCLGPKTLHYAKFWAQNATKTSAGNIPESLSNLFLRDNRRLLLRLLRTLLSRLVAARPPWCAPSVSLSSTTLKTLTSLN